MTSACGWEPLWEDDTPCHPLEGLPASLRDQIVQLAADLLWAWSGHVFGVCETTVRPCRADVAPYRRPSTYDGPQPYARLNGGGWLPVIVDGRWYNVGCGDCLGDCSCDPDGPAVVTLPGPIHEVLTVQVGADVLPAEAYAVANKRRLGRVDGGRWPVHQNLLAPLGDPDTWGVTYERGVPVPTGGRLAQGVLACELALAYRGDEECALPQRVQSVTRQGVTVAVMDSFENLDEGRTGIWLIDSWLSSVTRRPSRPFVASPDRRGRR